MVIPYLPCKHLFTHIQGAIPYSNARYGRGDGRNVLDNLRCTGRENSLLNCPHRGIGVTSRYCDHSDDAGVECPGNLYMVDEKATK